jgi:hypothetical protein
MPKGIEPKYKDSSVSKDKYVCKKGIGKLLSPVGNTLRYEIYATHRNTMKTS